MKRSRCRRYSQSAYGPARFSIHRRHALGLEDLADATGIIIERGRQLVQPARARQIIFIIRSKGSRTKGMTASEFDGRSRARILTGQMNTRFKLIAAAVVSGFSARIVARGDPASLT